MHEEPWGQQMQNHLRVTIAGHHVCKGHEVLISIEGAPIQRPAPKAVVLIHQVQRVSNLSAGYHLSNDRKNHDVALQNKLAQEQVAVLLGLFRQSWLTITVLWDSGNQQHSSFAYGRGPLRSYSTEWLMSAQYNWWNISWRWLKNWNSVTFRMSSLSSCWDANLRYTTANECIR